MREQYESLANAIILQAVKDYRKALKKHHKRPKYEPAIKTIAEVENFFRSHWFEILTNLDGETLIKKLKMEENINESERISKTGIQA